MIACALGCTTRDGHPYPAPEGYLVCDRCVATLRVTLVDIAARWLCLLPTEALLPVPQGYQRRAPGYESTPPGRVHIMVLRDVRSRAVEPGDVRSPLEVTHAWASWVRQQRGLSRPDLATVGTETATLAFHLDWIVRDTDADTVIALACELFAVRDQLRAVTELDEDEPRRAVVGYCTAVSDGERCGAPLRLPHDGGSMIRCPRCDARYDGVELIDLDQGECP